MNTRNDRYVENSDPHQKGWLNLSLGQGIGGSSSCEVSGPTTPKKLYTCSFCGRKFYSPQALGGHQNAHRRERDAARKHGAFQINQSMEMHSLLLVGTPGIITKDKSGRGVTYGGEKLVELKCSGSSYSNSQLVSQETDPVTLDLNLKL